MKEDNLRMNVEYIHSINPVTQEEVMRAVEQQPLQRESIFSEMKDSPLKSSAVTLYRRLMLTGGGAKMDDSPAFYTCERYGVYDVYVAYRLKGDIRLYKNNFTGTSKRLKLVCCLSSTCTGEKITTLPNPNLGMRLYLPVTPLFSKRFGRINAIQMDLSSMVHGKWTCMTIKEKDVTTI